MQCYERRLGGVLGAEGAALKSMNGFPQVEARQLMMVLGTRPMTSCVLDTYSGLCCSSSPKEGTWKTHHYGMPLLKRRDLESAMLVSGLWLIRGNSPTCLIIWFCSSMDNSLGSIHCAISSSLKSKLI